MWNGVGRGIRRVLSRRLDRRFVGPYFDAPEHVSQHWQDMVAEAGVELEAIVKRRDDTRGVFFVRHPERGRCVLKTTFAARSNARALAGLTVAKLASEPGSPIFPRIFAATPDYTLEQYIDGRPMDAWLDEAFDARCVEAYLAALKQWSLSSSFWRPERTMRPYEIREICRIYIAKGLWQARYYSPWQNLRHMRRFTRLRRGLAERIQRLLDAADTVQIPRTMMCGDMGKVNLLVQRETGQLYNVDAEGMGPGHWGFDCAYFLSSLARQPRHDDATRQVRAMVLNDRYLGSAACTAFFTTYTDVLSEIGRAVHAH